MPCCALCSDEGGGDDCLAVSWSKFFCGEYLQFGLLAAERAENAERPSAALGEEMGWSFFRLGDEPIQLVTPKPARRA